MTLPDPLEAMLDTEEARRYLSKYTREAPRKDSQYKIYYYTVASFFTTGISAT